MNLNLISTLETVVKTDIFLRGRIVQTKRSFILVEFVTGGRRKIFVRGNHGYLTGDWVTIKKTGDSYEVFGFSKPMKIKKKVLL